MSESLGWGIAAVLLGGFLNGSFVAPMKRLHAWKWENSWFVYSVSGLLVVPWLVALVVVPQLGSIFRQTSWNTLAQVLLFGFGWGVGSVLFGLGVSRMGLSVGYGIILGLIAPIGTFLPLVVLHPERLWTRQGLTLVIGTLIVIGGIVLCAVAGSIRERAGASAATGGSRGGYGAGLVICILAGIFSPMLNFAFVFGEELQQQALAAGASTAMASNAIWSLCLTAGFIANAGYAAILLKRNGTWRLFSPAKAPTGHWVGGSLMGIICFASFMTYGSGATALGNLGGIVGWPLFMSMSLITSNVLGALTGEWTGAPKKAYSYSLAGIGLLIVAITIISRGNT
jgi:L-rhamnose-H+ transport protein